MKDYIRLGLAIKDKWPEIDFGVVEIIEVPFGTYRFELPLRADPLDWKEHPIESLYEQESVEMHRFRSKQAEFMAGYAPVSNKLLVGTREAE